LVTINTNSSWTENAAITPAFRGGITNNGTFTAGTGVHTFNTNAQALNGTIIIPSVTVTGVTLTNNGSLTVGTALTGTGGLTNSATRALNIGGTCSITTLTNAGTATITNGGAISTAVANFTNTGTINLNGTGTIAGITNNAAGIVNLNSSGIITSFNNAAATSILNISASPVPTITTLTATFAGNTVNYSGAGAQTVKATIYYKLAFSGIGVKSMVAGTSVAAGGNLNIANGTIASIVAGLNLSVYTLTLGGTNEIAGTWGYGPANPPANHDTTHFAATTGYLTVVSGP
jgi:hypothetical protein